MTYEEKCIWLNRYRAAEKDARRLSDQIAAAQTAAARTTQALSPLPGGGGDGQNLARAIERKTELEQKVDALRPLRKQYYKEIFDALSRSGLSYTDYQILHKRYLECKTWDKVAEETSFALRWVYTRHRKAVEQLDL